MKTMKHLIIGAIAVCVALTTSVVVHAQSVGQDIENIYNDTLGSTNGAAAGFFGKSLNKSDTYCAGAIYAFNITPQGGAAVVGGLDRLFTTSGGTQPDNFTISGGFQLATSLTPLSKFGYTNFVVRTGVATLVGTPMSGSNGGDIMNLNRVFGYTDIHTWMLAKNPLVLSLGAAYGNRTGAGSQFDGNWVNILLGAHWGDNAASMASNDLEDYKLAQTAEPHQE
jgi:hypothetical protein